MDSRSRPFENAGVMIEGRVWTRKVEPTVRGKKHTLGEVVAKTEHVPGGVLHRRERRSHRGPT